MLLNVNSSNCFTGYYYCFLLSMRWLQLWFDTILLPLGYNSSPLYDHPATRWQKIDITGLYSSCQMVSRYWNIRCLSVLSKWNHCVTTDLLEVLVLEAHSIVLQCNSVQNWRAPWKNRIYWYIPFFLPITQSCSVSDVLFTGGRGVSDFSVSKYY